MRRLLTCCAAIILALSCCQAFAQEGGFKDPNTGKVWSYHRISSSADWVSSTNYAANYGVFDFNAQGVMTYYDDWRLPTVAELQTAIANGTIQWVNQNSDQMITGNGTTSGRFTFWTSTLSGKRPWYVYIQFGPNGEVIQSGSGQAEKAVTNLGSGYYIKSFMIRP